MMLFRTLGTSQRWMIVLFLGMFLLAGGDFSFAQLDSEYSPYYYKIPNVTKIYTTTHANFWPASYDSDGVYIHPAHGHYSFMMLSLSGLAAKACLAGQNDTLIDVVLGNYPWAYLIASQDLILRKGIQNLGTRTPWDLVDIFVAKGIVKGYVVYHYETGNRGHYTGGPFDHSANVATVYAHQLDAILIEESLIPAAQARGLTQLADCRGMTQEQSWNTYQDQIDKHAIVVVDPKLSWNRDYAIATGCFAIFPLNPSNPNAVTSFYRNTVLPTLKDGFPVLGWAGGDEFNHTEAATVNSGFNTATSFDHNLFVHGLLTPGVDDPIENYHMNRKSALDLLDLRWERDVHYTTFIMSDGDFYGLNNTYIDDQLGGPGEYFGHSSRGLFPMTWGCAAADLFQTRPSSIRRLSELATPNDSFILFGGGYYYPDLFPALTTHLLQLKPLMEKTRFTTWLANFSSYNSPAARAAQNTVAATLTDMAGLFVIQYSPYTAGQGNIYWTRNFRGYEIPVFSARYGIWSSSPFPNEGDPLEVAQYINNAPHQGELNHESFFDWTIVHIWSYFNNCQDMNQSGASFNPAQGIERCYAAAKCCFENLAPHVKVVSAEELSWLCALHLRTRDTLDRILDAAEEELEESTLAVERKTLFQAHLDFWRQQVAGAPLNQESDKREHFLKVQETLKAIRADNLNLPLSESFEEFQLGQLPQQGWINSTGNPIISDLEASTGSRSLRLGDPDRVDKLVKGEKDSEVWFEGKVLLKEFGIFDDSLPTRSGSAVLRFANTGILALDGDGMGSGTWIVLADSYDPNEWLKVKVRLDYAQSQWDLYINEELKAASLGFLHQDIDRLHGFQFRGAQFIDDIQIDQEQEMQIPYWLLY